MEFVVDTVALAQVLQFPLPVSFQQFCAPEHSTVRRFIASAAGSAVNYHSERRVCRCRWPRGLKAWFCGRSLAEIAGSNPPEGMDVCLL